MGRIRVLVVGFAVGGLALAGAGSGAAAPEASTITQARPQLCPGSCGPPRLDRRFHRADVGPLRFGRSLWVRDTKLRTW
jgi:hypothetical protein